MDNILWILIYILMPTWLYLMYRKPRMKDEQVMLRYTNLHRMRRGKSPVYYE